MDYLENYCFQLFKSQRMLYLREHRGNYGTMLILGVVSLSL